MAARAPIVFFPEGAYGPTNNCAGIGQVLRERGHRVVFVIEESFAGNLEAQGFEERLMRLGPPPEVEEEPGQFWKDFIRDTAPVFRKPTFDQLSEFIEPTWRALCDGSRYVDDRLREIIDELQPDVIVEDNVVGFPAIQASGRPWVRIVSCNPLELKDDAIPPVFSGYAAEDLSGWGAFRAEYLRAIADLHGEFSTFFAERGAPALPKGEFIHESDYLNLYLYPAEVDYRRSRPLAPTWHRLETCVRHTEEGAELPEHVASGEGALLYLSLGSLGSADVDLMKRLVDVLSRSGHRIVVSKGAQHDEFELADNMWGEEFLPQPAILPLADVVITHAGNNTTTECFHFGKPMVALPLFWDQYDNAQRVHETGFGIRLPTYEFEDADLLGAVERLLGNDELEARMALVAGRVRSLPGTKKAAGLIERLADERCRSRADAYRRLAEQDSAAPRGIRRQPGLGGRLMDHPLGVRLGAEALGTFIFFFFGFSGIAVVVDIGADAITPLGVAAGFGFGLALAITAFGHLSGGHFNPAVSAGLAVAGRFPSRNVVPYWIAQLVGGFGAVLVMAIVYSSDVTDALHTQPGSGIDDWAALVLEIVATALFVMVILTVATDERAPWKGVMAPLLIGLFIFTAAVAVGPASGGSFNPARSLDPVLLNQEWGDVWIYLLGPLAGGVLGGAIWSWLCTRRETATV